MVKSSVITVIFTFYTQLLIATPSAEDWYLSIRQEGFENQISPHRILFVTWSDANNSYELMPLDRDKFNSFGYLDLISSRELEYLKLLNTETNRSTPNDKIDREDFIGRCFQTTLADIVVVEIEGDERWQIYRVDKNGKPDRIFRGRGVDRSDAEAVYKWFIDKIGYAAIVLRRQEGYFLAALFDRNAMRTQVLALGDSAEKLVIPLSQQNGAGLLQFVDAFEGVAVYQALLLRDAAHIGTGTKLVSPASDRAN